MKQTSIRQATADFRAEMDWAFLGAVMVISALVGVILAILERGI